MYTELICFFSSQRRRLKEEIEDERKKLYDAIGYSEKGKAAAYKKEVTSCAYIMYAECTLSVQYIAHRAEITLRKVSFKLKDSTNK